MNNNVGTIVGPIMILLRYFPLLLLLLLSPARAYSMDWGFGVCCVCGGYPCFCGIIPCDASCGGKALTDMGTAVSQSTMNVESAVQALTNSKNTVNQSISSQSVNIVDLMTDNNQSLLRSMSASAKKISLALLEEGVAAKNSVDHTITQFRRVVESINVANAVVDTNDTFANSSQPVSSINMTNAAPIISKINLTNKLLQNKAIESFFNRGFNPEVTTLPNEVIIGMHLLNLDKMGIAEMIEGGQVKKSDLIKLVGLMEALMLPVPFQEGSETTSLAEINKKITLAEMTDIYSALMMVALLETKHETDAWASFYNDSGVDGVNEYSLMDVFDSEINSKLDNVEWWMSVKSLGTVGIKREILYQEALQNSVDYKRSELIDAGVRLNSVNSSRTVN